MKGSQRRVNENEQCQEEKVEGEKTVLLTAYEGAQAGVSIVS